MHDGEKEIRQLVATWMSATAAGDIETVMDLMTDDVVFLIAGQPPMRKAGFAAASTPKPGQAMPAIRGDSDIQEIEVLGDWAFMWSRLAVTVTPPDGAAATMRAGHTLSILRKDNGRWRIARDANMLVPVKPA